MKLKSIYNFIACYKIKNSNQKYKEWISIDKILNGLSLNCVGADAKLE